MKKSLLKSIAVMAMSLALAFSMQTTAMAMGDVSVTAKAATENVGEYTIALSKNGKTKNLTLGINKTLKLIVKDKNAVVTKNLKFSSSKSAVASISGKGVITTKKAGTTKINITNKKTKNKATINLKVDYVEVSALTLSSKSLDLNVGQSATLTATVAPAYSAVPKWTSFFPEIATVDNGVVTAKAPGTGIIVVNAGTKMEFCRVNVGGATVPVSSIKMEPYCSLTGEYKDGDTQQFSVEVTPSNATNQAVTWDTSDDSVADVDPNTGLVTFNGIGSTVITATAKDGSNAYDSCLVTVTDFTTTVMEIKKIKDSNTYAEITRNGADVTLSITGTGEVPNFNSLGERPWDDYCTQITKLEFGPEVTKLGASAFKGCTGLTHLYIPKNITGIGGNAFENCTGLEDMYMEKESQSTQDFVIESHAFNGCSSLRILWLAPPIEHKLIISNAFDELARVILFHGDEDRLKRTGICIFTILSNAY